MRHNDMTILVVTSEARGVKSLNTNLSQIKLAFFILLGLTTISITSFGFAYAFFKKARVQTLEKLVAMNHLSILTEHSIINDVSMKKYNDKLKNVEINLLELQELLNKRGIDKELSVGGEFEPVNRLSMSYIDFLNDDILRLSEVFENVPLGSPVNGKINSGYGYRIDPLSKKMSFHAGVDIDAFNREPIKATAKGKVIHAGWYHSLGKTVKIKHEDNYQTVYAHLAKVKAKRGDTVRFGDVIGLAGSTGRSTGPHLHYEVIKGGKKVDPKNYIYLK